MTTLFTRSWNKVPGTGFCCRTHPCLSAQRLSPVYLHSCDSTAKPTLKSTKSRTERQHLHYFLVFQSCSFFSFLSQRRIGKIVPRYSSSTVTFYWQRFSCFQRFFYLQSFFFLQFLLFVAFLLFSAFLLCHSCCFAAMAGLSHR